MRFQRHGIALVNKLQAFANELLAIAENKSSFLSVRSCSFKLAITLDDSMLGKLRCEKDAPSFLIMQ